MNASRYVSPLAYRRIFQGKRTLHQSSATTATIAGISSTTLIVLYYITQHDMNSGTEREHRATQKLSNASSFVQHSDYRRTETRCDSTMEDSDNIIPHVSTAVHYSEAYDPDLDLDSSGYTEEERFFQCVSYHRSLLHDYDRRWGKGQRRYTLSDDDIQNLSNRNGGSKAKVHHQNDQNDTALRWPRSIPSSEEVAALECDLFYCQRSPEYRKDIRACQSIKFRIASYYVSSQNSANKCSQREKGFRVIKELAEQSYPDAMCLYGMYIQLRISSFAQRQPMLIPTCHF
jgi:hypothetical protein